MAKVVLKKLKTVKEKKGGRAPVSIGNLSLPDKKTIPFTDMSHYTWLIYGERHIGKTELAAQFNDPFFMFFEPGGNAQSLKAVFVPTWEHFLKYIELLEKNPDYCQTVVIDVGGKCYDCCFDYTCRELGIQHPVDEAKGGKGWKMVDKYFIEAHNRIFSAGFGIIALAHSTIREVKRKDGTSYDKLTVDLGAQAFRYYCGTFDNTGFYNYTNGGKRVLTIRGDENVEAGTRCTKNFLYTDGTPIKDVSMGNSAKEAYNNLQMAFNNKLSRKGGEGQKKKIMVFKRK